MFNGLDNNGHKWYFRIKADSICVFMMAESMSIYVRAKGFPTLLARPIGQWFRNGLG